MSRIFLYNFDSRSNKNITVIRLRVILPFGFFIFYRNNILCGTIKIAGEKRGWQESDAKISYLPIKRFSIFVILSLKQKQKIPFVSPNNETSEALHICYDTVHCCKQA